MTADKKPRGSGFTDYHEAAPFSYWMGFLLQVSSRFLLLEIFP